MEQKVIYLYPDVCQKVYKNYIVPLFKQLSISNLQPDDLYVQLVKYSLWLLCNFFTNQEVAEQFLAEPYDLIELLEGLEEIIKISSL